MSVKTITVPEGKELWSISGIYKYVGPTLVIHHRGLKIPKTYTDGTEWEYNEDKKAPKKEEPKKKAPKKEESKKETVKKPKKVKPEVSDVEPTNVTDKTAGLSSWSKDKTTESDTPKGDEG